jgi:1-acyl-sn-glycerol-3-phosphate acyltransferase
MPSAGRRIHGGRDFGTQLRPDWWTITVMGHAWSRRLVTIPTVYLAFVLLTLLLPVVVAAGAVIDTVRWIGSRTPAMALRMTAFGWVYLLGEVWALPTLAVIGLLPKDRAVEVTYRLQMVWLNWNFKTVQFVFRMSFTADGTGAIPPAPILVLSRHASLIDTLLPGKFVTEEFGIPLRYILKKELLVDPALDIAGNRLPNVFVDRSGDTEHELLAIRDLVTTMPDGEGLLIYPEGTRYSEEKRLKYTNKVAQRGGEIGAIASSYRRVLPPRPAGTLAMLEARPLDIVMLTHRGLEGFAEIRDIWSGGLVGSNVQIRFWRIPHAEVPHDTEDRRVWLFSIWASIDRWVTAEEDHTDSS